jgi:large subunit ribosomal protein L30
MANDKTIAVTCIKSIHGRNKKHQACVRGLGITKINKTVMVKDTPANRGMINKARYLLHIEGEV